MRLHAGLALLLGLAACGEKRTPTPEPERARLGVRVARAELRPHPTIEEVVGTVRAARSATIAPTITGIVADVRVTVGTVVRPGDVLVRLSTREIDARLERASAIYARAKLENDRAAALFSQGAVSSSQADAVRSELAVASAARTEASTLADRAVLRAPFQGVVTAKLVNAGDTAMPGQPLVVIEAAGGLRFEARVSEKGVRGLVVGQEARLRIDGLGGDVVGTIGEIDPVADAATRTLLVKVDVPGGFGLQAGRFGRLLLVSGTREAIVVAASAVVRRGQLEAVFVVDAGVARLRLIRTGREAGGQIEVVSGLGDGDQVVISELAQLTDGQPVEVRP